MRPFTLYFDQTNARRHRHRSGLMRVALSLGGALEGAISEAGGRFVGVHWSRWRGGYVLDGGKGLPPPSPGDWFLTTDVYAEAERPGSASFLAGRAWNTAAWFHDAIPLQLPEITWAKSVERMPHHLRGLLVHDRVFVFTRAMAACLEGYWNWLEATSRPSIAVVWAGAEFRGTATSPAPEPEQDAPSLVLGVGIVEPRKNQALIAEAARRLWDKGCAFRLLLAGRVNPEFGRPLAAELKRLRRAGYPLEHRLRCGDRELEGLYQAAAFTVVASRAEGCGLPLLESIASGTPCLASALPAHRETAADGGCVLFDPDAGPDDLAAAMERLLTDPAHLRELRAQARARWVPGWGECARKVLEELRGV
ncbi:MAG: glycosyltransferase [Puniceicoccaceae bacterium]|nr:MAG: glycosyltransferase [Puniceicoccaceae bacterium]